jgi:hypothetical protein
MQRKGARYVCAYLMYYMDRWRQITVDDPGVR